MRGPPLPGDGGPTAWPRNGQPAHERARQPARRFARPPARAATNQPTNGTAMRGHGPTMVLLVDRATLHHKSELQRLAALLDGGALVGLADSLAPAFASGRLECSRIEFFRLTALEGLLARGKRRTPRPEVPLGSWNRRPLPPGTLADRAVHRIPFLSCLSVKCLAADLRVSASSLERGFRAAGILTAGNYLWDFIETVVWTCHREGLSLEDAARASDRASGSVLRRAFRLRRRPFPAPWPVTQSVGHVTRSVACRPPGTVAMMATANADGRPRAGRARPRSQAEARRA